jgi:hypothetical protein
VHVRAVTCVAFVLGVVLLLAAPASAQREHFELKIGPTYEQGTYGNPELTRIGFLPVTLKYLGERFDVAVTPSFLVIDSPDNVVVLDGRVAAAQTQGAGRRTESGIGDTHLKGRFFLLRDQGGESLAPSLTPNLRLKIPTADEDKLLGTGEFDVGLGLEFDKTFGSFFVLGEISYTFVGNPPGQDFRDQPAAYLGAGVRASELVTLTTLVNWRRSIIAGREDPVEVFGILTLTITPTISLSPYVYAGVTRASADFGVGAELSYKFGRY